MMLLALKMLDCFKGLPMSTKYELVEVCLVDHGLGSVRVQVCMYVCIHVYK